MQKYNFGMELSCVHHCNLIHFYSIKFTFYRPLQRCRKQLKTVPLQNNIRLGNDLWAFVDESIYRQTGTVLVDN